MKDSSNTEIRDRCTDQFLAIDTSLASAFIDARRKLKLRENQIDLDTWFSTAVSIAQGGWNSIQLTNLFLHRTPELFEALSADAIDQLMELTVILARQSTSLATDFLKEAGSRFDALPRKYHSRFLQIAILVAKRSKADIWLYLENFPQILNEIATDQMPDFLALVLQLLIEDKSLSIPMLMEMATSMQSMDEKDQSRTVLLATDLARVDSMAAVEFFKSVPFLLKRSPQFSIEDWLTKGIEESSSLAIHKKSSGNHIDRQSLRLFFRMESRKSEESIAFISQRLELASVKHLLQLYSQALAGDEVHLASSSQLTAKNLGWSNELTATTDGINIYVPAFVDRFTESRDNLQLYKAMVTHQAGRIWFGSFEFNYGKAGFYLRSSLRAREDTLNPKAPETPLEELVPIQAFFNLFSDRTLIENLFTLVEDGRIDRQNQYEYGGLQKFLKKIKLDEIQQRPYLKTLGMREAFIENLLRCSLGHIDSVRWPEPLQEVLLASITALHIVYNKPATVQDSSEVAAFIYDLAVKIPNVPSAQVEMIWQAINREIVFTRSQTLPEVPIFSIDMLQSLEEIAFHASDSSILSGEFKPELVQAIDKLIARRGIDDMAIEEMTTDQLAQLLANSVEIDENVSSDAFLKELSIISKAASEHGIQTMKEFALENSLENNSDNSSADGDVEASKRFLYDEWNFRAQDYFFNWCQVREILLKEGHLDYYDKVLNQYSLLAKEIRHQFEYLKPDLPRKVKYLDDGPDIDLDQSIQFLIEKKAGTGPRARIYTRRDRTERDLAIAFLLDMSGSTQETIGQEKRVIDLEKEAIILMIEALEIVGDSYGVYGFSGRLKENVLFYVVKEMHEGLDDLVKKRIQSIEPLQATRMGAAIRHCSSKLVSAANKNKIMILLSDGRPRDQDYGNDQNDRDFAINDTRQALIEARRSGIAPFLIAVEQQDNDYLEQLASGIGYEVIANIESLPKRLPEIYRNLTSNH